MLLGRAEADDDHRVAGLELVLLGHEGRRGCVQAADDHVDVGRQRGDHVRAWRRASAPWSRPQNRKPKCTIGPASCSVELELRHDREVAAAAAQGPEEVGVLGLRGRQHVAGRGHDAGRDEVVDRQPVLAAQPSHAAAEGQPADAGVADQADGHGEAVLLGGRVEVAEQRPAADLHPPRVRVDVDVVHRG